MYKALKGTWGKNKNKICFSDRPLHFGLGFCVRLQDLVWVYLDLGLYIHYRDFSALLAHQHGCVVPERYFSLLCFCDLRGHCCLTINTNIKLEVLNWSFGRMSNLGKKKRSLFKSAAPKLYLLIFRLTGTMFHHHLLH